MHAKKTHSQQIMHLAECFIFMRERRFQLCEQSLLEDHTGYVLGMLIATFSPRRSLMFRVNVLQTQRNLCTHQTVICTQSLKLSTDV